MCLFERHNHVLKERRLIFPVTAEEVKRKSEHTLSVLIAAFYNFFTSQIAFWAWISWAEKNHFISNFFLSRKPLDRPNFSNFPFLPCIDNDITMAEFVQKFSKSQDCVLKTHVLGIYNQNFSQYMILSKPPSECGC